MRKLAFIAAALLCVTVGHAKLSDTNSKHNFSDGNGFSNDAWNASGELCKPCHTPHNAQENNNVIWNHDPSTSPVYQNYVSPTTGAQTGSVSATGTTKLCMSCHDGTTALDAFGGSATSATTLTGTGLVGVDLRNDHPIGVSLATANTRDSAGYKAVATVTTSNKVKLFSGVVECASCHDVHDMGTQASLLRISNANSALCLECHTK